MYSICRFQTNFWYCLTPSIILKYVCIAITKMCIATPKYALPLRNMHCYSEICHATPKYALPLRNMHWHSKICIATPTYVLPLRNMHCHSEICIATPKYALPLRHMHCHSEICIATPKYVLPLLAVPIKHSELTVQDAREQLSPCLKSQKGVRQGDNLRRVA